MSPEDFTKKLETVHRRVRELTGGVGSPEESVEHLRAALEELRVADEELRQQNEELAAAHLQVEAERRRYQELFQLAPEAYVVTTLAGIITEANQSASCLLGVAPQFLGGKALATYIVSQDRARFRTLLNAAHGLAGSRSAPFRFRTRAGLRLYAELTYSVVHDADGAPTGFRWLVRDVTNQD